MRPSTTTSLNAVQGAARKAHFEAGGTVATWRGSSRKFTDRKKKADRLACRRPSLEG